MRSVEVPYAQLYEHVNAVSNFRSPQLKCQRSIRSTVATFELKLAVDSPLRLIKVFCSKMAHVGLGDLVRSALTLLFLVSYKKENVFPMGFLYKQCTFHSPSTMAVLLCFLSLL